jgi:hypothetical protein
MPSAVFKYVRRHHLALFALFFALGGTSFAAVQALPRHSVGTKQLKKNAVVNSKIKNNAVTGAKVKDDSLTGADILESSLGKIAAASTADNATHATAADSATNATNASNATSATNASRLGGVAAGEYATRLWAHVEGGVRRGNGVTNASCGAVGQCVVTFDRDIHNCAAFATISSDFIDYSNWPLAGEGEVGTIQAYLEAPAPGTGWQKRIHVVTTLADGKTPAAYAFNVMVMC